MVRLRGQLLLITEPLFCEDEQSKRTVNLKIRVIAYLESARWLASVLSQRRREALKGVEARTLTWENVVFNKSVG